MYNFKNDYNQGCHENILKRLQIENQTSFDSYGEDKISNMAKEKIKTILKNEECELHFLSGGTQTNLVTISSVLKPYQGVISAVTGHIYVHETGAIEATGHQIIPVKTKDGKIKAEQVEEMMIQHKNNENYEHSVQPGLVYISNPTEVGTIYRKEELVALNQVCSKYDIPLYMDGARLSSALTAKENNVEFQDLCKLCDLFYIGGTKCGGFLGECLVIANKSYQKDFRYMMKQRGALLAKGFLLGIQFDELFTNNLYLQLGQYENHLADRISEKLNGKITFYQKQYTNQVFLVLSNRKINELNKKYSFTIWDKIDDNYTAIRICVSWGIEACVVEELIEDILKSEEEEC